MRWIEDQVNDVWRSLVDLNKRQLLLQIVSLGLVVTSALIIWKSLMLFTGSESPVVVVLSGSMEPGFQRGDILFLNLGDLSKNPIQTGEIVVFNVDGRDIPIVHRVIKVHEESFGGHMNALTKGDNNEADDSWGIYNRGQEWLNKQHIMGRAVGYLPYLGMVTIIMNDYPMLKYGLIMFFSILVITSKEGQ